MSTRNKIIPDESITSSSYLSSDRAPSYARLNGPSAWCSAPGDNSSYIQILLEEETLITAIETQGSRNDSIWSKRYDVWYLKRGKWILHRGIYIIDAFNSVVKTDTVGTVWGALMK